MLCCVRCLEKICTFTGVLTQKIPQHHFFKGKRTSCGSFCIHLTLPAGIQTCCSLPNPAAGARASERQEWHSAWVPHVGRKEREMKQHIGKYTGLSLPCGSGMAKNNIPCGTVARWCPLACATGGLMPPPAPGPVESTRAKGHDEALPSEPAGSQKSLSPEGHSQLA